MIQIFLKEFNGFLNSLIAYIVIGVFCAGIGYCKKMIAYFVVIKWQHL